MTLPERGKHGTMLALIFAGLAFAGWVLAELLTWDWGNYLTMVGFLAAALGVTGFRARGEYARDAKIGAAEASATTYVLETEEEEAGDAGE